MKKTYFASDFHLGADARLSSRDRERQVQRWLESIAPEADTIWLVGDLFEFWFEYKSVVPKGYSRFLGALAALRDAGIRVEAFTGNHDLWMFGYFQEELGIPVHRRPIQTQMQGKTFFIGHGDGLGPGDTGYKIMKKVFTAPFNQWLFRWLHPDLGARLAHFASQTSRGGPPPEERDWLGEDREWLLQYCRRKLSQGIEPDYFVFGHRHLPIDWLLDNGRSRYINLGEWMHHCSYAVLENGQLDLQFFEYSGGKIVRRMG
jgi:UDP-2,3-diacylglucosamine hydrolase